MPASQLVRTYWMLNSSKGARDVSKMRMRKRVMRESQKSEDRRRRVQHPADWMKRENQGMTSRTRGSRKVKRKEAR